MEQEKSHNYQTPTAKVYRDKHVWVGTFLGGPLVAGYFIAKNYKTFGEKEKATTTWVIAILATAALFWVTMFAPYIDRVPQFIIPVLLTGIAFVLVQMYQGEKIQAHIRAGGKLNGWWKVIGAGLLGAIVTMIPFVGTGIFLEYVETSNRAVKTYGSAQSEINFDRRNITEDEVDRIAEALRKTNLLDDDDKWFLYAKKVDDSYEISFSTTDEAIRNPQILELLTDLRKDVQTFFPDNKIIFNLVTGDFSKIQKRLE